MKLLTLIRTVPALPGVYQFFNEQQKMLYIGKARNMKKRIQQHFQKNGSAPLKNKKMLEQIRDIKWTSTDNEVEALILENTLIKDHQPKYNILLRDDKNFLYIKISNQEYPQISLVRRITDKGSTYFGPYTSATNIRATLTLVGKIFPYQCLTFFKKGMTGIPCFNYHIERCPGLCTGKISAGEYQQIMDKIKHFLRGDIAEIIPQLEQKMANESREKAFEKAAKTRDQMVSLKQILENQKVVDPNRRLSQDILGHSLVQQFLFVSILKIRQGVLRAQENYTFTFPKTLDLAEPGMLTYVVQEYYEATMDVPQQIILTELQNDKEVLEQWLSKKRGSKVEILLPLQGRKHVLLDLARKNAEQYAEKEMMVSTVVAGIHPEMAVQELQQALGLKHKLRRIECYDISHLAGKFTVASMIVFQDGKPEKNEYRQFHIHSVGENIDDFQSMREVLERRLKYISNPVFKKMIKDKKESFLHKPDLIILDGGKGQLSIGVQVMSRLGLLKKIPIISLAKEEEDIFIPAHTHPLVLAKDSQAQYLIERMRDEAHRFAISKNRRLRLQDQTRSKLDEIPGIGPTLKKKLLERFGSVKGLREADPEELAQVVGSKMAQKLKEAL